MSNLVIDYKLPVFCFQRFMNNQNYQKTNRSRNDQIHQNDQIPLVSVLIPVYNGTPYLEQTVESVLASTQLPIEVVLVDDGSTDGSKAKCRQLNFKYPQVIYIDFRRNRGMTRCLNEGIKRAQGKYIARINQDDLMVKGRLEKQVNFLENHQNHVAVGSFIKLFTNDNPHYDQVTFPTTDEELKRDWLTLSPFSDPSVMYRRDAVLKTPGYSQEMWPADDVQMWYQLGSLGKLANLPEFLTLVRWHAGAGSIKSHRLQMKKTWQVHIWAARNIRQPSIGEFAFWCLEHLAGRFFPPQFNWFIYRLLRKIWPHRLISKQIWQVWERITAWLIPNQIGSIRG